MNYDPGNFFLIRNFFHPGSGSRGQYWIGKYWILDPAPQHWMISLKGQWRLLKTLHFSQLTFFLDPDWNFHTKVSVPCGFYDIR